MTIKYTLKQFEEIENKSIKPVPSIIVDKVKDIYSHLFPTNIFPIKKVIKSDISFIRHIKKEEVVKETNISKIRTLLNKLTDKTYDDILVQINSIMLEIDDKKSIGVLIFDIACTNRFYSELYTNLCGHLIETYDFMRAIFDEAYKNYILLFDKIEYIDPKTNYDKFCENNKTNEKRKTMSLFIVNLVKKDILKKADVQELFVTFLSKIIEWKTDTSKKNETSEITENINILYKIFTIEELKIIQINDKSIYGWFQDLSQCNLKEYTGINSKTKFKYMDILQFNF